MKLKLVKPQKNLYSRCFILVVLFIATLHTGFAEPLIGEGTGKSKDVAYENALAVLAQQILVQVSASSSSHIIDNNGDVDKNNESLVALQSNIRFQGVQFKKPKRKRKIWTVRAILTDDALRQTISFLDERLPDTIEGLTRLQISDAFNEVQQLQALLHFSTQKRLNIPEKDRIGQQAKKIRAALQLRIGNYGWVRFIPPPNIPFNENFIIEIDDTPVAIAGKIFLPVGTFRYRISRENYANEQGILRISRGREERISLFLVHLPKQPVAIALDIKAETPQEINIITATLTEILQNYTVTIDPNSRLVLHARADSEVNNSVKNFEHLFATLQLNFTRSGKNIRSHSESLRLFNKKKGDIGSHSWRKLSEKTLRTLISGNGLLHISGEL